jgi:hypothetical protein
MNMKLRTYRTICGLVWGSGALVIFAFPFLFDFGIRETITFTFAILSSLPFLHYVIWNNTKIDHDD